MRLRLLKGNDCVMRLEEAQKLNGTFHDGTSNGDATLYRRDGVTAVTGQVWPAPFVYVAGSRGVFEAPLSKDLNVTLGERLRYKLRLDASDGKRYADEGDVLVENPSGM